MVIPESFKQNSVVLNYLTSCLKKIWHLSLIASITVTQKTVYCFFKKKKTADISICLFLNDVNWWLEFGDNLIWIKMHIFSKLLSFNLVCVTEVKVSVLEAFLTLFFRTKKYNSNITLIRTGFAQKLAWRVSDM